MIMILNGINNNHHYHHHHHIGDLESKSLPRFPIQAEIGRERDTCFEARRVDCIQSSGGLNHHDLAVFEDRWIDQKKIVHFERGTFWGASHEIFGRPQYHRFFGKPNDSTHPLVELLVALISTLSWFP